MNNEQEQEFWKEFADEEEAHNRIVNEKNGRLIKAILKAKGFNWLCNFLYDFRESECYGVIEFTNKPAGQEQSTYWGKFGKGVYVEQYCHMEDSYSGWIYFPIKSNKYLKCRFEC